MKKIAFCVVVIFAGCTQTRYTTFDPHTGAKTAEFRTSANFNLANAASREDSNNIGGLPLFGGTGVDQATRTTAAPVPEALTAGRPTIAFGDFEVFGTIDHATPIRENWIGIRGLAKSVVTAVLGTVGLKEWGAVKKAEEATARAAAAGSQAVETEALRNATEQATIAADVEKTKILAE